MIESFRSSVDRHEAARGRSVDFFIVERLRRDGHDVASIAEDPENLNGEQSYMNDRIVIDPKICHGKPVIRGTRTPVTVILDAIAGGDTYETLEREYSITVEDIRACVAFASSELGSSSYHLAKT
jgi:uncharacterized protein (DUF433 family)